MAVSKVMAVAPSFIDRVRDKISESQENRTNEQVRTKLEAEFFNMLGISKSDYERIGKEDSDASRELMEKLSGLLKKAGEKVPDALKAGVMTVGADVLGSQTMLAVEELIAMVSAPPLSVLIAAAGLSAFVVAKIIQAKKNKDKDKVIEEITQVKDNIEKAKVALESIMPEMVEKYKSSSKADFKKELSQKIEAIFEEYGIPYTKKNVKALEDSAQPSAENANEEQAKTSQDANKLNGEQAKREEEKKLKEQLEAETKASLGGE